MTLENLPAPKFVGKTDLYAWLAHQTECFVDGLSKQFTPQANLVLSLANVAALCFYELNRFADAAAHLQELPVNWFGFYLVQAPGVLALGPFQGRPACTSIRAGRGVCGSVAASRQALVVPDVHAFPGHIACDVASASEVVVPILAAGGGLLGLIDVDSTRPGHFDDDDRTGLEAIAVLLARHLEFPVARALAANPALYVRALSPPLDPRASDPPTATLALSSPTTTPPLDSPTAFPEAERVCRRVGPWALTTVRLDRISDEAALRALGRATGVGAFPEIQFPANRLAAAWAGAGAAAPPLVFDAAAVLADAAAFYGTAFYRGTVRGQAVLPPTAAWARAPFGSHDAGVDWLWRHRYYGLPADRLRPLAPGLPGVDWALLRDNALPIFFFGELDLFEDDLHDLGVVRCFVKFRAMATALFILFRHFVRIDHHLIWIRDVRIFHRFDQTRTEGGAEVPHIVVLEQFARLELGGEDGLAWKDVSPDQAFQRATVLSEHTFCVDTTPT